MLSGEEQQTECRRGGDGVEADLDAFGCDCAFDRRSTAHSTERLHREHYE